MKYIRITILYLILGISIFILWKTVIQTPCSNVIEYDIGEFDERFLLDRDIFVNSVERAESSWEDVVNRRLFVYVPGADFKINLIFSDEQERLYEGNNIADTLDSQEGKLDLSKSKYKSTVIRYESTLKSYESQSKAYEKLVKYWNDRGGAPSAEYKSLQLKSDSLNRKVKEINTLRNLVNKLAKESNIQVDKYNKSINDYNMLFKDSKEFDAGNTNGKEINVYSYDGLAQLHSLLVHEFGHVLGIDHIDDPKSVMFYLLNKNNALGVISENDTLALKESCNL